ncbi:conserved Plasmodium protein, unknown function [Plasmodium ovale wallikeri]|uniref:Uncharacterized protein n=1 Tax=Plasmodium ovale wallikeri TaxID=864142 RepID=A0A1A8ZZB6_PLAOA|nr:conserved Plasmodium protein, unknown function [Plasmodium ovale wallikeri]SBT49645.1 conserved Plasmodium protein, unknown function [Plasmodium ovale wallikeri]
MDGESKSVGSDMSKHFVLEEISNLQNDICQLNNNIKDENKCENIKKEANIDMLDLSYNEISNIFMGTHDLDNNVSAEYLVEENAANTLIHKQEVGEKTKNEGEKRDEGSEKNETSINHPSDGNYELVKKNKKDFKELQGEVEGEEATEAEMEARSGVEAVSNPLEETNEDKSDAGKMKMKIQNLLKLIGILKEQINQKDQEIYRMGEFAHNSRFYANLSKCVPCARTCPTSCARFVSFTPNAEIDFKLRKEKSEKNMFTLEDVMVENESNSDRSEGDNFLMKKMKSILISQNEEIVSLNEELKKKTKEIFYLNEENMTKNEKLTELKKEIETNYMHLKEYKNIHNEMEVDANNKIYNAENYLNITNQKLIENDINIKEKKLNIEKQKRVIKELYNQLNKKEEKITELRSIIESIELNNSRDIIKYKQNNMDLINRLSLNNSLMNSQKIEIENMHMNYKQIEEELKNKDNELKKLHKNLLAKDEENNKMLHDMNRLKFDMEVKNIDVVNVKQKIKNMKRECSIHLKKQKERFTSVINEIYKEKDEIIKNHLEEMCYPHTRPPARSILLLHFSAPSCCSILLLHLAAPFCCSILLLHLAAPPCCSPLPLPFAAPFCHFLFPPQVNLLKDEILKKSCEIEKLQDRLLDYESKLLIYENNNEIKILKKNEDHLRKLLSKHIRRNEQLLNTTLLLQKSTLENNTLEKKIIELKAKTYRKDQEIKKLQETNSRKKAPSSSCSVSADILDTCGDVNQSIAGNGGSGSGSGNVRGNVRGKTREKALGENSYNDINIDIDSSIDLNVNMRQFGSICADEENSIFMSKKTNDKNNTFDLLVDNDSKGIHLNDTSPLSSSDDPVYIALCEYFNCFKQNNTLFKINKINDNTYLLNDKKVFIKFINGDLYVEDDAYPVKLQDYLLKITAQ